MSTVTEGITLNQAKCLAACTAEIFATDKALDLVKQGIPFRDAYRHVAAHLDELDQIDPVKNIQQKSYSLAPAQTSWTQQSRWLTQQQRHWKTTIQHLLSLR
ncbi:MAG TPA: hypothetical protein DEG44_02190 [Candidatus Kerfeldbacteria bacterium]|nr:hypothetical protein [Candidatus Kerfeldbacteria bacterium]